MWRCAPAVSVEGAGTPLARPINDNHAFLANMIDSATHDSRLLEIRSRRAVDRRFTRVDELLLAARARYRADETEAATRIAKIEGTIADVMKVSKAARPADLPPDIRAEIDKLNTGLIPVRQRLREVRREMRVDIERLGRTVTIANLAAGPILTLLFAGLVWWLRRTRGQGRAAA